MYALLWLVPILPLAGFVVLALAPRLTRRQTAYIGVGSAALSALIACLTAFEFIYAPPESGAYTQRLWSWFTVKGFSIEAALRLDALSLVMIMVVTVVGFLIHLYSSEFMEEDNGYRRFFAYMNLFVASMLVLVLADNLLFVYLGWEGVGLCSYLLIGFWYKEPYNGYAARKAFIVTRIGDTAFLLGILLLAVSFGTLNIQGLMNSAAGQWFGSNLAIVATILLLGGALGKSAQMPLQVWLPDAMAGPTPVSALIHAATMVTAGVYLIARTHVLFELAPLVMSAVAVIGAATLLISSLSALAQSDIKRVLAYSTISQIGYMFLALGVGAWPAALFHFMTHAFFKALLFLGAGAIATALHHEYNIFRMGGLRKEMPLVFWTFLAGAASLSALPLVTAGYYSKDLILENTLASGATILWTVGVIGAVLTALYTFRVVFIVFFNEPKTKPVKQPGLRMTVPLVILAVLSLTAGFVETSTEAGARLFTDFISAVLPTGEHASVGGVPVLLSALAPLLGVVAAYLIYIRRPEKAESFSSALGGAPRRLLFSGWYFDKVYDYLVVAPYIWLAKANKDDFLDMPYRWLAFAGTALNRLLVMTQTGKVRAYAFGLTFGATLALTAILLI